MTRPLPGSSSVFRPPRAGDLCVLLVSSRPVAPPAAARISELRGRFGGRQVEPLHVTCDRFDGAGDEAGLLAALARDALVATAVPVLATSLMRLRRHDGSFVLKLVVEATPDLERIRGAVHRARRAAAMTSAYGDDVAYTVTVLEGVRDGARPETIVPFEAFRADRYLLSRFTAAGSFETVRTFDFTARP